MIFSGTDSTAAERRRTIKALERPRIDRARTDQALSPDQRAEMVVQQMTLDEKIEVLHGRGGFQAEGAISNGGAGVIQGVPAA